MAFNTRFTCTMMTMWLALSIAQVESATRSNGINNEKESPKPRLRGESLDEESIQNNSFYRRAQNGGRGMGDNGGQS